MHADEVETDLALVRSLLAAQFPEWAEMAITPVASYGTDHDIYRLGDDLAVRLPRIAWAAGQAAKEAEWLPKLAPHLPLAVPVQVARGKPVEEYPFEWSVHEWLPGENANGTIDDLDQAAVDLAAFVRALRQVDARDAPPRRRGARGAPLAELDKAVRRSIDQLDQRFDRRTTLRSWEQSLDAPPYRAELGVDDASWLRGRGWALCQAVLALPYYWHTNPGMVRQASHALSQVLADNSP